MDDKVIKDDVLEQVTGGISREDFERIDIGTRIYATCSMFEGMHGAVTRFFYYPGQYERPSTRRGIIARFDDGREEALLPDAFELE